MKYKLVIILAGIAAVIYQQQMPAQLHFLDAGNKPQATSALLAQPVQKKAQPVSSDFALTLKNAFAERQSDLQVQGYGRVVRILADDLNGSRHQRFIIQIETGQTLLIAHNIDLAARIANLKIGDKVSFYGEYEWNKQGGVIHWTHHDPKQKHPDGWLKHNGQIYQ